MDAVPSLSGNLPPVSTSLPRVELPFVELAPGVGAGAPAPHGWRTLEHCPLLILVGVTGVGKSTVLAHLAAAGLDYTLLPDRRDLTDRLIIAAMQAADGDPIAPVADRSLRFAYTRRYRQHYPGGMADAVAQVLVAPDRAARPLIFDGLRGANEVSAAADRLPLARFAMLDAPDWVRVQRLLNRQDDFDQVNTTPAANAAAPLPAAQGFAALGIPEAATLFSPAEETILLGWLRRGDVSAADLRAKLQIVVEERRSYDPAATLAALRQHAPARTLHLDTVALSAQAVATRMLAWLNA